MADGSDLSVRFGADTAGVRTGANQVKEELGGLQGSVRSLMDAFLVLGGAASGSFREIRTGAMEAHEQVKGLSESVVAFREAITGIGEALIAAFAIEQIVEFAKKMGEMGEKVEHIGLALGLTTEEVQQLQATANATGMSLDGAVGAVTRLERALGMAHAGSKRVSEAFKELGVDINVARTPAELFQATVAGFAQMPPTLEKSQIAAALFGRNLQEVAPLLGLNAAQLAEVAEQTEKYGLKNVEAVAQSAALGRAFNENKNAMQGMANVFAQAFAPVLTVVVKGVNDLAAAFIQSYREGGTAKGALDALVLTLKVVADAVAFVGSAVLEMWHTLIAAIESLIGPFMVLGYVIKDALSGNIDQAVRDAQAGMAAVGQSVRNELAKVKAEAKAFDEFGKKLWNPPKAHSEGGAPQRTTGAGYGEGSARHKKEADDRLQIWKTEFLDEENAHNDMLRNETQDEIDFWNRILATQDVTAKQRVEIERRVAELTHTLKKQAIAEEVADAREAQNLRTQQINAELQAKRTALQEEVRVVQDAARDGQISWQTAHSRIVALIEQEVTAQKQAALAIYTARIQADKQIESRYAQNTAEFRKAVRDEQLAWQQMQDARVKADADADRKISQNDRQTVTALKQQWHGYIDSSVQAFGSGIKGMIEGTKSLRDVLADVADSILETFIQIGERMVENWIITAIIGKATQSTTGVAQVASNAAVAGSAAFASTAAIPIIGPALAPAAAAAAYAGAMAFAPLAIAEQGWGEVPYDNAPTLLHKKEMVLPATLANPLRAVLANGSLGAPSQGKGGDIHLSPTWHISNPEPDIVRQLQRQPRALKQMLIVMARNGELAPMLQAAGVRA